MSTVHGAAFNVPVWDGNTDEEVLAVNGSATFRVPDQCVYVIFTVADVSSGSNPDIFISPDGTDINSGFVITDSAPGPRFFGIAVAPGTLINLHAASGLSEVVNVLKFYNKP